MHGIKAENQNSNLSPFKDQFSSYARQCAVTVKKSYFKTEGEESVLMATKQYLGLQEVVTNWKSRKEYKRSNVRALSGKMPKNMHVETIFYSLQVLANLK